MRQHGFETAWCELEALVARVRFEVRLARVLLAGDERDDRLVRHAIASAVTRIERVLASCANNRDTFRRTAREAELIALLAADAPQPIRQSEASVRAAVDALDRVESDALNVLPLARELASGTRTFGSRADDDDEAVPFVEGGVA